MKQLEQIKKSLKKRHQFRTIWITLTDNLKQVYLDEEENLQFNGEYLEEISGEPAGNITTSFSDNSIKTLLEQILENKQQKSEVQNLSKIAKDFMTEKFNGKNVNANQWIRDFEKECERCLVQDDRKKIEILNFFMEKSGSDWYSTMILKHTVESEWNTWKTKFCEAFGNKGWSPIRNAFSFKYLNGSLLEYAIKKEKLLLQVRKSIDTETLIDLIAIGLPNFVADKIDGETFKETEDLYNELNRLEHIIKKPYVERREKVPLGKKFEKAEDRKPCRICERAQRGGRYHNEPPLIKIKLLINDTHIRVE